MANCSKEEEAAKSISQSITTRGCSFEVKELNQHIEKGKSDWKLLLEPGIFRAVIIGVAIAILGQFMGVNAVLYYGPSIFESAGLSSGDSLFYQSLIGLVNVLTTVLALLIIDKVGRKKLVYIGVSGMIISLIMIGIYFIQGAQLGLTNYFLLVCFLLYIFFTISISAVFCILSEMYPEVREKRCLCRIIVMRLEHTYGTTLLGCWKT